MRDEDIEDAIAVARRHLDEALAAADHATPPAAGGVHIHGGTVGAVHTAPVRIDAPQTLNFTNAVPSAPRKVKR